MTTLSIILLISFIIVFLLLIVYYFVHNDSSSQQVVDETNLNPSNQMVVQQTNLNPSINQQINSIYNQTLTPPPYYIFYAPVNTGAINGNGNGGQIVVIAAMLGDSTNGFTDVTESVNNAINMAPTVDFTSFNLGSSGILIVLYAYINSVVISASSTGPPFQFQASGIEIFNSAGGAIDNTNNNAISAIYATGNPYYGSPLTINTLSNTNIVPSASDGMISVAVYAFTPESQARQQVMTDLSELSTLYNSMIPTLENVNNSFNFITLIKAAITNINKVNAETPPGLLINYAYSAAVNGFQSSIESIISSNQLSDSINELNSYISIYNGINLLSDIGNYVNSINNN